MSTFLCLFRPTRSTFPGDATDAESDAVQAHFFRLQNDAQLGKVRVAGRTLTDQPLGILIFHASDHAEAEEYVANDPCVVAKIFSYEIHPYAIAIWANEPT